MITYQETAQLLEKAADVVQERGYYPDQYDCPSGVCQVGALAIAAGADMAIEALMDIRVDEPDERRVWGDVEEAINAACVALHGEKWSYIAAIDFQDNHYDGDSTKIIRHMREVAAALNIMAQEEETKVEALV